MTNSEWEEYSILMMYLKIDTVMEESDKKVGETIHDWTCMVELELNTQRHDQCLDK